MSRRAVFDLATFDFEKHYRGIYNKICKLLKDFDIEQHIIFKNVTGQNHCSECHIQISEPVSHEQAKKKIFKVFVNERNYLTESELKANKDLFVPGKGIRNYQFDIFVVNVPNFLKFMSFFEGDEQPKLNIELLKKLEQELFFAVELDGGGHSEEKDAVRDRFFFTNYNIVTVRYPVHQLVPVEESKRVRKQRLKYMAFKQFAELPLFNNITTEQIVSEAKNIYRSKYFHIK